MEQGVDAPDETVAQAFVLSRKPGLKFSRAMVLLVPFFAFTNRCSKDMPWAFNLVESLAPYLG